MSEMSINHPAFDFHTLMPSLIIDALESIGLQVDSGLTALNSYENRVYQFLDEERKRYVVKFYRPERWSAQQIQEEHDFAFELVEEEIPVIAPLLFNKATLHHYHGFMFAVFASVGGRQYEVDNDEQLEWVGRFLGRIHQVGKVKKFSFRPSIGFEESLYQSKKTLLSTPLLTKDLQLSFHKSLDNLIKSIEDHWHDGSQIIRLHGDCHPGNILWRDGPSFVDFDDARNGPAVQDLWMLLHSDRQTQQIQLDILLEAYSEFCQFDPRQLALIEPLRAMRMIYYLAWLVSRWQDPAFPKAFPWLAESGFWQQQIAMFNEQDRTLQQPPLKLMTMY